MNNFIALASNNHCAASRSCIWLSKQYNNANVLVSLVRFISKKETSVIIKSFILATFEGGRHQEKINKIKLGE